MIQSWIARIAILCGIAIIVLALASQVRAHEGHPHPPAPQTVQSHPYLVVYVRGGVEGRLELRRYKTMLETAKGIVGELAPDMKVISVFKDGKLLDTFTVTHTEE